MMTLAVKDKRTTWKNSVLNEIWSHDRCDTGVTLSPIERDQANWEMAICKFEMNPWMMRQMKTYYKCIWKWGGIRTDDDPRS